MCKSTGQSVIGRVVSQVANWPDWQIRWNINTIEESFLASPELKHIPLLHRSLSTFHVLKMCTTNSSTKKTTFFFNLLPYTFLGGGGFNVIGQVPKEGIDQGDKNEEKNEDKNEDKKEDGAELMKSGSESLFIAIGAGGGFLVLVIIALIFKHQYTQRCVPISNTAAEGNKSWKVMFRRRSTASNTSLIHSTGTSARNSLCSMPSGNFSTNSGDEIDDKRSVQRSRKKNSVSRSQSAEIYADIGKSGDSRLNGRHWSVQLPEIPGTVCLKTII